MRWFLTLCLTVSLCGCGDPEQNTPNVDGAGTVASETNESRITTEAEAAQSTELIEAAKRTGMRSVEKAIQAVKHREDGVTTLVQALRDENHFVQLAAATALSEMGSKAVPDVIRLLSDEDDDVRTWAMAILGAIGKPASKAVPLLKAALDDQQPEIAELAAIALAQIGGPEAPRAEPAESSQMDNQQDRLRQIPRIPAELKPALIALRRGDKFQANQLVWKHIDALEEWLSKAVDKGPTTRDDIVCLLGPHLQDLDRPQRDAVVTQQYSLGSTASFTTLVFDFDARTGLLLDWSTSQGICGYCPHVFADDGRWRLEGKMLAGCVGSEEESTDTILLPRLVERGGRLQVRLSNLAPEIEFLDQIQLGSAPLEEGEELDVCHDGRPFVWSARRQLNVAFEPVAGSYAEYAVDLAVRSANDVIVLEMRNTSAFETAMREFVFGRRHRPPEADIQIQFVGGASVRINPIGTKFLRRVVVPVSADAKQLKLRIRPEMWIVRRMWIGTGRSVDSVMQWQSPIAARGPTPTARILISRTDQRRLALEPMQEVNVGFISSSSNSKTARLGYVLRVTGYYEFQRRPEIGMR